MASGGKNFNDFSEIVPTRKITTKTEKTFLVFSSVAAGLFLDWAQCCSINSIHLNPALRSSARIVSEWNKLPQDVVEAPSINTFENKLDRHWHDMGVLS